MDDKKREYLIKTMSRTKRKDYENYIVNAIWHKLNRLDLQPVTQQYVKRADGKYGLLDLYFPQLNIGIECDEEYHISNQEKDQIRELTMQEMLASFEETASFKLYRVKAYESIEEIERQIDAIVNEIKQRLESEQIQKWDIDRESFEVALVKGSLEVNDNLHFRTIVDICRCFGKNYDGIQRSFFNLKNGYYLWCPKLAVLVEGKATAVARGWLNELSSDWNTIYESNDEQDISPKAVGIPRITFAKSRDALGRDVYRFIGVFQYSEELSSSKKNAYKRVEMGVKVRAPERLD